jgi:2-hydroxy-3-oxopropionate reductase
MGKPMAKNLIKAGHRLVVHNRSRAAADEVAKEGATAANSPADVARAATIVITMLPTRLTSSTC